MIGLKKVENEGVMWESKLAKKKARVRKMWTSENVTDISSCCGLKA